MPPEIISDIAGAVADKDEWAIILQGTRSDDGYEVNVNGYRVPEQDRQGAHVTVKEFDLLPDDVGHLHSHNNMSAFFSGEDKQKTNPRFSLCIVIAQASNAYLGFSYEAVGKVRLPCGSTGEITFKIQPTVGPELHQIKRETHKPNDLGDCPRHDDQSEDAYHVHFVAVCGLSEDKTLKTSAFSASETLLSVVDKLPRGGGFTSVSFNNPDRYPNYYDTDWCKKHKKWDHCKQNRKVKIGEPVTEYFCPKCEAYTLVVAANPSKGDFFCRTCNEFWVKPNKKEESQHTEPNDTPSTVTTEQGEEQHNPELLLCEECGKYMRFEGWYCEECGAEYCSKCNTGHLGLCVTQQEWTNRGWSTVQ